MKFHLLQLFLYISAFYFSYVILSQFYVFLGYACDFCSYSCFQFF